MGAASEEDGGVATDRMKNHLSDRPQVQRGFSAAMESLNDLIYFMELLHSSFETQLYVKR